MKRPGQEKSRPPPSARYLSLPSPFLPVLLTPAKLCNFCRVFITNKIKAPKKSGTFHTRKMGSWHRDHITHLRLWPKKSSESPDPWEDQVYLMCFTRYCIFGKEEENFHRQERFIPALTSFLNECLLPAFFEKFQFRWYKYNIQLCAKPFLASEQTDFSIGRGLWFKTYCDPEDYLTFDFKNFHWYLQTVRSLIDKTNEVFDVKKWDPTKKFKGLLSRELIYMLHRSLNSSDSYGGWPSLNGYKYFKGTGEALNSVYLGNGYLKHTDHDLIVFDPEFLRHRELWILPDPILRELALNFIVFHPPPRWNKF